MPNPITASIDVTKVTKARLFPGRNGAKYLNIVLIPSTNDKYDNDFMVVESVSKEERAQGIKGPILGNAKIMVSRTGPKANDKTEAQSELPDEEVPF